MLELVKRRTVDLLVEQFWKQGYLTVRRKYGTYLPEPTKIGAFEVDIIAKYKKDYAIGIVLTNEDFKDKDIIQRINYLATRQTKYSNKKVLLFIGVPGESFPSIKEIIDRLNPEARKNIRIFQIAERPVQVKRKGPENKKVLFS